MCNVRSPGSEGGVIIHPASLLTHSTGPEGLQRKTEEGLLKSRAAGERMQAGGQGKSLLSGLPISKAASATWGGQLAPEEFPTENCHKQSNA